MTDPQSISIAAEAAVVAGDLACLERLLLEHGPLLRQQRMPSCWSGGLAPNYAAGDARTILAREHHFADWEAMEAHLDAMRRQDSPAASFEAAVDAVVAGDVNLLERLLRQHPELVHLRSARVHRSTLLHYVGANGVEGWRQKTPANAVRVAEILLQAGAEVDVMADMYGGSTVLGLAATSVHPRVAGVQNDLLEVLLGHGAAIDHPRGAGNGQGIIQGCLSNGRPGAAEFLAKRGAGLDLEGAAGVGRLEIVKSFFDEQGGLRSGATQTQLKSGFLWACQYGRTEVVEYLLQRGIEVGQLHRKQTGLHWASYGGHRDIVQRLLERRAPVHVEDEAWHKTPLGWALYGWRTPPREACGARHHEVVELLVRAGSTVEAKWLTEVDIRADSRMLAALGQGFKSGK